MIAQKKGEERINFLVRVLHEFMDSTIAGEVRIDYDGVKCDGFCLSNDIAAELNIDVEA